MAKGAANEGALGKLHARLTDVFLKVLDRYEQRMDTLTRMQSGSLQLSSDEEQTLGEAMEQDVIESEMLQELFADGAEPNPAMLAAISKFLKDNAITFDSEKVDELSSMQRRLQERRQARGTVVSMTGLKSA